MLELLRRWSGGHGSFQAALNLMLWDNPRLSRRSRRAFLRERFFTLSLTNNFSIGALAFGAATPITGDVAVECGPVSIPVAQPGSVTTHTSNSDVVLTMTNSGHGIVNTARCDLYWGTSNSRRGMIASNVSGTSVELTGGTGDNAPAALTSIVVGKCVTREFSFTNANVVLIAAQCDFQSIFAFVESDGTTEDWFQHLIPSPSTVPTIGMWYSAYGASPLTGTAIAKVYMSHADIVAAHNMQAGAGLSI